MVRPVQAVDDALVNSVAAGQQMAAEQQSFAGLASRGWLLNQVCPGLPAASRLPASQCTSGQSPRDGGSGKYRAAAIEFQVNMPGGRAIGHDGDR